MLIIYLSGIDGCGKTTQSEKLVAWLNSKGIGADYQWLRWEPSIVPVLKKIRAVISPSKSINKDLTTSTTRQQENTGHSKWKQLKKHMLRSTLFRKLWLWYASHDYYRAYKRARPSWKKDVVVLDRYIYDFIIDQSLNFDMSAQEFTRIVDSTILKHMDQPDISIVIDIPAEVGYRRKQDGTPLEYLRDRESRYKELPSSDSIVHIDGTLPPDDIHARITDLIRERAKLTT